MLPGRTYRFSATVVLARDKTHSNVTDNARHDKYNNRKEVRKFRQFVLVVINKTINFID